MRALWIVGTLGLAAACGGYAWLRADGLSARHKPGHTETVLASFALHAALPTAARSMRSTAALTPDAQLEARRLYSENCAVCHAMHGNGQTVTARGLSPGVPDLSSAEVQRLTDGELFYVIRNGVRFTGMPGWEYPEEQVWGLVKVVRSFQAAR